MKLHFELLLVSKDPQIKLLWFTALRCCKRGRVDKNKIKVLLQPPVQCSELHDVTCLMNSGDPFTTLTAVLEQILCVGTLGSWQIEKLMKDINTFYMAFGNLKDRKYIILVIIWCVTVHNKWAYNILKAIVPMIWWLAEI